MTSLPVVFRDAAELVTRPLREQLPGLGHPGPVTTKVPQPRPAAFTTVRRVGGPRRSLVVDGPILVVEAWGPDTGAAMDRAQAARAVVTALVGQVVDGTQIYRVDELAGPADLPDPSSTQPRVTFTVEVWLRGTHPTS